MTLSHLRMAYGNSVASTPSCWNCGHMNFIDDEEGTYCENCFTVRDEIPETGVAEEDFNLVAGGIYDHRHSRVEPTLKPTVEPLLQSHSLYKTLSQVAMDTDCDLSHVGPTKLVDFGAGHGEGLTDVEYCKEVRMRYVLGIQLMIQYQCEALVDKFGVSPMICGISASIWLRYVNSTGIFAEVWGDEIMFGSERQDIGKMAKGKSGNKDEPRNVLNQRMVVIWYRSLRKKIPLSCSLAVVYLACHVAREPIIPTDIQRWAVEGKLPYLSAFVDIEKVIGGPTRVCPFKASSMFRPSQIVPPQKLESLAASIAESIQLSLPPVNFYAIARRYLDQLSLPVEKILPHAVRLYEWSMLPDLWLSTNEFRFPPRSCVMAILVVTIRIIYNINGLGKWEASFSDCVSSSSEGQLKGCEDEGSESGHCDEEHTNGLNSVCRFKSEAQDLLCNLERKYDAVKEKYEHSKDLPSYLQYCKDVVFAGCEPSYEDHVEQKMMDQFWDFYMKSNMGLEVSANIGNGSEQKQERGGNDWKCNWKKRRKEEEEDHICSPNDTTQSIDDIDALSERCAGGVFACSSQDQKNSGISEESSRNSRDVSIRLMKLDMEENGFCYIPPRVNVKRRDYLYYARKRDDGSLSYVAHADYYILLRACARAAEVDVRVMHLAVLKLEKRLAFTEEAIARSCKKLFNMMI